MKIKQEKKEDILNTLLGIKMSSTLLTMKRLLVKSFEQNKLGINFEEWINLLPLLNEDGLTQKEFSILLGKDKTTISRLISSWEKKGFVKRKLNQNDKRAWSLVPTEKVLKLHSNATPTVVRIDQIFKKDLSVSELNGFLKTLEKIQSTVNHELIR